MSASQPCQDLLGDEAGLLDILPAYGSGAGGAAGVKRRRRRRNHREKVAGIGVEFVTRTENAPAMTSV